MMVKRATMLKWDLKKAKKECWAIFSKYIRLRDKGVCFTCGKKIPAYYDRHGNLKEGWKAAQAGHWITAANCGLNLYFHEKNVHCQCYHCLTPDMKILMKDFSWKAAGNVCVGDEVVSFSEKASKAAYGRKYVSAVVTHASKQSADVFEVVLENGDVVKTTGEHLWLIRPCKTYKRTKWVRTDKLIFKNKDVYGRKKTGTNQTEGNHYAIKLFDVRDQDMSYDSGYLAGMLDGDGFVAFSQTCDNRTKNEVSNFHVGFTQNDNGELARIEETLGRFIKNKKINLSVSKRKNNKSVGSLIGSGDVHTLRIMGSREKKIEFLQMLRPNKIDRVQVNKLGSIIVERNMVKIMSVKKIGKMEICVIETDSGTFICNGYAHHNCNINLSGNWLEYEKKIHQVYGIEAAEELKSLKWLSQIKYTVQDYVDMIEKYNKKFEDMLS